MYNVVRNSDYDFTRENYSSRFPNLHRYPATMLPQIGIEIFKELRIKKGSMLDPYCGTGSSMLAGALSGITEFMGYDINPLAILIAKAKYTKLNISKVLLYKENIIEAIYNGYSYLDYPDITNINFWFSKRAARDLNTIKYAIESEVLESKYKNLFLVAFSETCRSVSYTRNDEFKLYRMDENKMKSFNPDVFEVYINNLNKIIDIYSEKYLPILNNKKFNFKNDKFYNNRNKYDVILTSPPYGDSRTTVAYGQFSTLSNEWLGVSDARKIDRRLMGGVKSDTIYKKGILKKYIKKISSIDMRRGLEVSSFYFDLENSILKVSKGIKRRGFSIYIVGNRTVKSVKLPTDRFIAEQFEINGFKHLFTYSRNISAKSMPSKNSPTNKIGKKMKTMHKEYIVVCRKK